MRCRVLAFLLAAILASCAAARAEEWRLIMATQIGELYVGGPGAQRLPSGMLGFWERIVYSGEGRRFALGRLAREGMSQAEIQKHDSMVEKWSWMLWDPASQRLQILAIVCYGPGGQVLSARTWPEQASRWRPVKPGSYTEQMVQTAEGLLPKLPDSGEP